MAKYVVSPQAARSLRQISQYTLDHFGHRQQKKYLRDLRAAMRAAAKQPHHGRDQAEIKPGYRSVASGSHRIYYRMQDTHIEVIDVLHQSMEPALHL